MSQHAVGARTRRWDFVALFCTALMLMQPASAAAMRGARPAPRAAAPIVIVLVCAGDCNGDGQVSIDELVAGVNIAQGRLDAAACPAFDADGDDAVTIAELVAAVSRALAGCDVEAAPLTLSAAALAPGEMLTIFHSSITAGSAVVVTFRGAGRYQLTAPSELTEDGVVQIAVPPLVDTSSGAFTTGEVAVSIAGVDAEATLFIEALPEVGGAPGELTAALLDAGFDSAGDAVRGLLGLSRETGIEQPSLLLALYEQGDLALRMMDEINGTGMLTLRTPSGPVVMDAATLAVLDRVIAAPFLGFARQHSSLVDAATTAGTVPTRDEFADLVDQAKRQTVAGMQVLGSYVSVLGGLVAVISSPVPGGQPLAGLATATAVVATGVVTIGSALISIAGDISVDAIRGEAPDLYRAANNAGDVVVSGLRSIALTAASTFAWAGTSLVGLVSLVNDIRDGVHNARDLTCASEPRGSLRRGNGTTAGDFCRLTQDTTEATATPTRTARAMPTRIQTATRTRANTATAMPGRTATPTRVRVVRSTRTSTATPARTATPRPSATATRTMATVTRTTAPATSTPTRTATATRSPTRTATPAEGRFTVLFYQNTDGSTGSNASNAQIRLSGAADFPTISWTGAVGSALQVTVGDNAGLIYGINAAADDEGQPIPIRAPIRYGDYGIPGTVGLFQSAAPPLRAGGEYVVVVTPYAFQGLTAAISFRVNR